jgi:hypothetical protein
MQLIRAIPIFTLFLFAVLYSNKLIGLIKLNEMMSLDEQKKTGVSQLSEMQKQELEKWMNDKFILKSSRTDTPPLTLQQNLQSGAQLELSDGSIYEIAPSDRSKTTFWLTPITLKISPSNDPKYPALLTNTLTGVSVRAKQVRAATVQPQTNPPL